MEANANTQALPNSLTLAVPSKKIQINSIDHELAQSLTKEKDRYG